jgi:hypothetical protein
MNCLKKVFSNLIIQIINKDYFQKFFTISFTLLKNRNFVMINTIKNIFDNFTDKVIDLASICIIPVIKTLNEGKWK